MDLIGQKFGRLLVLERVESDKYYHAKWKCLCDCGNIVICLQQSLVHGDTVSCGCYNREIVSKLQKGRRQRNEYDLTSYEYGVGITKNTNREFYFDKEDFDKIKDYCWREDINGYIVTNEQEGKILCLHRLIMDPPIGMYVDHIGHILYDNRKSSLRVVAQSDNIKNKKLQSNNKTGVSGVYKINNKWKAAITCNKKTINLGTFLTKEEAIAARKAGEEKYFGEFSYEVSQKIAERNKIK